MEKICAAMQHGGPDDEGFFTDETAGLVLGHRRLSLLDLSSAGQQPMIYQNRYVISFNGEIYNYLVLKNELQQLGYHFKSQTDTEVVLAAYEQWGTQSFAKLEGMFAFAIWDKLEKILLLVRDRSGIKPLYYIHTDDGIAFASETKVFQYLPTVPEQNTNWPVLLLAYGHLPEPVTTYQQVKPLPKGFFLQYQHGKTSLQNFGFYSFSTITDNKETAAINIASLMRTAVKNHLLADVPIGVFLSGGVDSGILFLLAAEQKKQGLNSLSLYFDEANYSEKMYQDLLLQQVNCERNQYQLEGAEFLANLPQILQDMDLPSCDGINTWFISKYAKAKGLKAVLSGIGADELLGGYPSFNRLQYAALLQKAPNGALGSKLIRGRKLSRLSYLQMEGISGLYLFLRGHFTPADIAKQLDATEKEVWEVLQSAPVLPDIHRLHPQNQASWMETNLYMQNQLLRDTDVMSMAHGIEVRVPFLDHNFQKYCMSLAPALKYGAKLPKALLIQAFKKELPEQVWNRPKMGFSFPFKSWIEKSQYVQDNMMQANGVTRANYKKFKKDKLHWSQILSLVILKNAGHA